MLEILKRADFLHPVSAGWPPFSTPRLSTVKPVLLVSVLRNTNLMHSFLLRMVIPAAETTTTTTDNY